MKISLRKLLFSVVLGIVAIIGTLFIPQTISTKAEQAHVYLGFPVAYVIQNQTRYDPPYPWRTQFRSIWEDPTEIIWVNLLLETIIAGIVVVVVMYGIFE